jgi:hypothetical protein
MRTRVHFPKPGFFFGDATVELWIDERLGYRGGFRDGFEVWADLAHAPHTMRASIALGPIHRQKYWQLVLPAADDDGGHVDVTLRYSRLWGNFKGTLLIGYHPAHGSRP